MGGWCGIALALREPDEDGLVSRLPTYLHPLAGRGLGWHVLRSLLYLEPPPESILLVGPPELGSVVAGDLTVRGITIPDDGDWWRAVEPHLPADIDRLVVVDAAAATLSRSLQSLASGPANRAVRGPTGDVLAVVLSAAAGRQRAQGRGTLQKLGEGLPTADGVAVDEAYAVRDRITLARASVTLRNRIVGRLMRGGATFLAPGTVLVDVDVTIGSDSVIYPGVVLEGRTSIGAETVIGPGCRIIDCQVGSGVELKGWNYLVQRRIRNRAVLEPYVRRGFD